MERGDPIALLVDVAGGEAIEQELSSGGLLVERAGIAGAPGRLARGDVGVVLLGLAGAGSLEALDTLLDARTAPVVVLTSAAERSLGAEAVRAGAEDHLVLDDLPPGLLPRALRYAADRHRLRRELRELVTQDEVAGLWNLRGFLPLAEHHLRLADRTNEPVVLVFVRLDELGEPGEESDRLVAQAAAVVREAVREADVAARIAPDTFCVLLTGRADGAEVAVLSRLVEGIAARRAVDGSSLALSVGSAVYDPARPESLEQIFATAARRMAEHSGRSDTP